MFNRLKQHRTVLATVLLMVLWNLSIWRFSDHYYLSAANSLIDQKTSLSQQRANDLADSIERNLKYLHGIPDLLSNLLRVKWALSKFDLGGAPSALPLEERRKQWTAAPDLNDLSRYLALAEKNLNVDLIYVVNSAGDCVAASNWDTPGSSIGTNFAERDFFVSNKAGRRGMQYAVGKTTHIAGLYFSTPVFVDGKFLGAVVAKADVPNLSFLIKNLNAFVADSNGVIILATDKTLEMLALPEAGVNKLPEAERFARYRRSDFPPLQLDLWPDQRFPSLMRISNSDGPYVIAANELGDYGLQIYVENEFTELTSLDRDHLWRTLLICALGNLLILAISSSLLYLQAIRRSKALLWKKANFDGLSGLPNREMFRDRLAQEIKKSDRTHLPLALILIDLDQFKEVNDTLGHEIGDILLQEAALRIVDCVRTTDTVARLGGDEFTIVLPLLSNTSHTEDIAQKIITRLAEPFHLRGEIVYISASLGITLYPTDATDIDEMIRNADQAMYVAKNNGRNRFSYFTAALQEAAQNRLRLTNDLRRALTEDQFRVYFQPIVELSSGRVYKAEALLRWQHPVRGMVSPLDFIPLAEETGLIVEIGAWVRKESMLWCKRWNTLDPGGFQISINKSPVEFMDEDDSSSVARFIDDLREQSLGGNNFAFEITEGLLLNANQRINDKLMALRDAGIQVSIDDFGTGYSSLSYLKKFDIDYLKIDQSFVRNLEHDPNDVTLCEAIIVMAHKLGLKVIAEGVETKQQRDILLQTDCDYVQGYLYSRPVPPDAFEKWLSDHRQYP